MSLLIKALEKAEHGKSVGDKNELTLEPLSAHSEQASGALHPNQTQLNQQAAATVFSAKDEPAKKLNKLVLIGAGCLLLAIIAGVWFYRYLESLNQPEIILAHPVPAPSQPVPPQAMPVVPAVPVVEAPKAKEPEASLKAREPVDAVVADQVKKPTVVQEPFHASPKAKSAKSAALAFGAPVEMAETAAVKITRNNATAGVNPNLWAAYQAFNAGDDATAQRNYRQVLQADVRNVDALLGMAAIAARQGRNDDSLGWYRKVLEVEPKNEVAQTAMVNVLAQADPVASESRIKNLIAQQPESANLYAALGNLYIEQNQWPSAQQAYFQAHHFDPDNAEYTFNLAVSLEHIGKSALALPYYKRALELLPKSGASAIDRAQLESRIYQLQ